MNELFNVKDKVVVITGGAGILGKGIAAYLAKEGAKVVVLDRSEEAGKAFQRVLKRKKTGKGIVIDGYRNFLFLNQKGMPMTACYYTSTLRNIVKKYNKYHDESLPKITPHILRHTFCTRLAQKNMNPKNLQYIMGHSSIMITLNLYAHASQTGANMEMRSLIA